MWFSTFGSWRATFVNLFVLLTLVLNAAAQALGVVLDKATFEDSNLVCYSSKLTFEQDTSSLFTDEQLFGLAKTAYEDMTAQFPDDGIDVYHQPIMMAALAIGKNVYLSSSLRGGPFLYNHVDAHLKPKVLLALERCQTALQQETTGVPVDIQHRNRASCAEIFAVHQYYVDPDVSEEARRHHPPGRVAVWGRHKRGFITAPQAACGGGETMRDGSLTWGCKHFMKSEGIRVIPRRPKPVNLNLPDPFPPFSSKQISIMYTGRRATDSPGPAPRDE
ncbi:hypothetical protein LZ31DRAFT_539977 [Colletotrichum somersetense]|nr:hypothetical protein LZ31DRAFT_539977 [Colletotrichum somersetense]